MISFPTPLSPSDKPDVLMRTWLMDRPSITGRRTCDAGRHLAEHAAHDAPHAAGTIRRNRRFVSFGGSWVGVNSIIQKVGFWGRSKSVRWHPKAVRKSQQPHTTVQFE